MNHLMKRKLDEKGEAIPACMKSKGFANKAPANSKSNLMAKNFDSKKLNSGKNSSSF
jgi:hypothetical protein